MKHLLALALTMALVAGCTNGDDAPAGGGGTDTNGGATDNGDNGAGNGEARATEQVPPGATLVSLNVPNMMCEFDCAPKVKDTLQSVPGVTLVRKGDLDVETKIAKIYVDPENFDAEAAIAALDEAGFGGTTVKN